MTVNERASNRRTERYRNLSLSLPTRKRIALLAVSVSCFIGAELETYEPDMSGVSEDAIEKFGPEHTDYVDTTLKSVGLVCLVGVFNVKPRD